MYIMFADTNKGRFDRNELDLKKISIIVNKRRNLKLIKERARRTVILTFDSFESRC